MGAAKTDPQITYSGTYSAQFMQKQTRDFPMGRIRLFDFYAPLATQDPTAILGEILFRKELELIVWNLETSANSEVRLQFYGITANHRIRLGEDNIYVKERITI